MDKKHISIPSILIIIVSLSIILSGCNTEYETPSPDEPIIIPDEPITQAKTEGMSNIVDANNEFALNYYNKIKDSEENVFFSPYSISSALAMTYEGAKGQTAEEIQSLFYLPEDDELRRTSFEETNDEINKKDKEYSLHVANALWAQKDFEFRKDYFDLVEKYYGGSATNLDFYKDPESSRLVINDWVEEKTNDKIKDLIPHGAIKKITRLVLTNAIYFKGTWITQFDEEQTKDEDFKVGFGKTVKVPLMSIKENTFNYAETDDLQILELDYEGDELSMLFLLPDNMNSLEKSLTTEKLAEWKDMLRERRVDIYIPKFKFETKYFMAQDLVNMGMPTAFSDNADFTGMEDKPDEDLKIDQVIHQAFVEVNEEGTEAAAATAVIMVGITSVGHAPKIPIFRADHPFIFIIQQKETGNILFLGKVNDPNK